MRLMRAFFGDGKKWTMRAPSILQPPFNLPISESPSPASRSMAAQGSPKSKTEAAFRVGKELRGKRASESLQEPPTIGGAKRRRWGHRDHHGRILLM